MMNLMHDAHVALTFLTRLGRARISSNEEISRSMPMYPLIGALIGAMLVLFAFLPMAAWPRAWTLTGMNIYLTRGLHWDGWADLWDGWGSGTTGDRFWAIVKDSHIGAFGVMGLVLGIGLQTSLVHCALTTQAWFVLGWSFMFGRFCCLLLARMGQNLARPGLGQNALLGATNTAVGAGAVITLIPACGLPLWHLGLTLSMSTLGLVALIRLARTQTGLNGDFLGAAIILGELCALLPLACHPSL